MGEFWFNTYTHQVEEGPQSDYRKLLGPYATREEAQRALQIAAGLTSLVFLSILVWTGWQMVQRTAVQQDRVDPPVVAAGGGQDALVLSPNEEDFSRGRRMT